MTNSRVAIHHKQVCQLYFQRSANNKGADQTVRMRRLVCAFVLRMQLGFSRKSGVIIDNCTVLHTLLARALTDNSKPMVYTSYILNNFDVGIQ